MARSEPHMFAVHGIGKQDKAKPNGEGNANDRCRVSGEAGPYVHGVYSYIRQRYMPRGLPRQKNDMEITRQFLSVA